MRRFAVAVVALLTVPTGAAQAMAPCPGVATAVKPVLTGQGSLESVIVDARGRLFYTDTTARALRRIDAPGAPPKTILADLVAPGGLALDNQGRVIVGSGDSLAGGALGNVAPAARLLRVGPDGGPAEVVADGLQMANGVVRARDGTLFASSDVGLGIDRVAPDGAVTLRWAIVASPNGLAIDRVGRYMFAAQTFVPAAIARIDLRDPSRVETYVSAPADFAAGLDGMTIDGEDRLYVTANVSGEVWRIGTDRSVCAVGTGLVNPSAVAFGEGTSGFSAGRLFAVGFDGTIAEVPGGSLPVTGAPAPALRAVRFEFFPRTARVRDGRVRVRPRVFNVYADGSRRRRAVRVAIAGRRIRTGRAITVRVGRRDRVLTARFTARGIRRTRTIRLLR